MTTAKSNPHKGYTLSSFNHYVDRFQPLPLKLMPSPCVTRENRHHIKSKKLLPFTTLMLAVISVNTAHAAISATTAQTIQGTAPYFTLGGVQLNNTAELLGFTYTDASGTVGIKATADAAVDGTTIIVDPNMKMSDIKALVPITNSSTLLSAILATPGADLAVADADSDASAGNTSAMGALKAYWTKDGTEGYSPSSTEKFDACSAYQLTIAIMDPGTNNVASTAGNFEAQTTYGDPNTQQYAYPATAGSTPTTIYSATYTIQPKVGAPYACWAQPNLTYGSGPYQDTAYTDWDSAKGFKGEPTMSSGKTFPTTGFYGAWFNLTVAGTTASDIINTTTVAPTLVGGKLTGYTPIQNGVKLKLEASATNIVTVTLYGPRDANVTTQTEAGPPIGPFSAPTFTLKDASGTTVYAFEIGKWFITRNVGMYFSVGQAGTWNTAVNPPWGWNGALNTPNYCANLGGTGKNWYSVPSRAAFTNSAVSSLTAYDGTAGSGGRSAAPNRYRRAIGGGLFSEWGFTHNGTGGYPQAAFVNVGYWASEPYNASSEYMVYTDNGEVSGFSPIVGYFRAACESN